jgi:uncharacterized OB-fold protein
MPFKEEGSIVTVGPVRRDDETAAFLDGTARGEFLLRDCRACGTAAEPQAETCPACLSADLGWRPAAGGARVVSWAVAHHRPLPDGTTPRTVLVVAEFDEGPWWWSQVVDADPEDMTASRRLRVAFERADGAHEIVPVFRLAR